MLRKLNEPGTVMQPVSLYLITAFIFLAADIVMLRFVMQPLFQKFLGDWLLDPIRAAPAIGFYLAYVAGLVWLVSWPAYRADTPHMALINGAILGAVAYGTYEFTNYATLTRWSLTQVAVDGLWGTAATGIAAWLGVLLMRVVFN